MTYDTSGIQLANIPHRHTNTHTQLLRRQPGTEREAEINKQLLCGVCVCVCLLASIVSVIYLVFISSFTSSMNQEQWLCVTLGIGCLFCYVCLC